MSWRMTARTHWTFIFPSVAGPLENGKPLVSRLTDLRPHWRRYSLIHIGRQLLRQLQTASHGGLRHCAVAHALRQAMLLA